MKDFNSFISNNNKALLTIETDEGQYDENWLYTIDVSKIWSDFSSNSNILIFNSEYASLLITNQQKIISNVSDICWDEIEPIINNLKNAKNNEDSEPIYNKLYDVFDKYEIYIDTGKIEEDNEIPTEI
jgi:hypothetical protein